MAQMKLDDLVKSVSRVPDRAAIDADSNYPCNTCGDRGTKNCSGDTCGIWADWYIAAHNAQCEIILKNIRQFDY